MIDILKIEPSTILKDLQGQYVFVYGPEFFGNL